MPAGPGAVELSAGLLNNRPAALPQCPGLLTRRASSGPRLGSSLQWDFHPNKGCKRHRAGQREAIQLLTPLPHHACPEECKTFHEVHCLGLLTRVSTQGFADLAW